MAWLVWVVPLVFLQGGKPLTLAEWLGASDVLWYWGDAGFMVSLLLAVSVWGAWQAAPALAGARGHPVWLLGFGMALLVFLAGIKAEWRGLVIISLPLMAAAGIGWVTGFRGLRRFWVPVGLIAVAVPPPLLLDWHRRARGAAQSWMGIDIGWPEEKSGMLQHWFGPDVLREGAPVLRWLEDWLPAPAHAVMVAVLLCWMIRRRPVLKTGLILAGLCLAFLEMGLNTGC